MSAAYDVITRLYNPVIASLDGVSTSYDASIASYTPVSGLHDGLAPPRARPFAAPPPP